MALMTNFNFSAFCEQKYMAYDRFRMTKYRPSKNQSERSDLPQDYLCQIIIPHIFITTSKAVTYWLDK